MLIFVEQKSYASVVETPEEQAMSDVELKAYYMKYLDLLRGKIFVNKALNIPIEVNREIKGEMRTKIHVNPNKSRPITRIKLLALKIIPYLLMDSDPDIIGDKDYKNRHNIKESHLFKYGCKINGIRFIIHIRTVQRFSTEHRLYFLSFEDLELTEKR
jgi:hypothetical protein